MSCKIKFHIDPVSVKWTYRLNIRGLLFYSSKPLLEILLSKIGVQKKMVLLSLEVTISVNVVSLGRACFVMQHEMPIRS